MNPSIDTRLQVGYLADHPETIETVSRWLHKEFLTYNPGETLGMRIEEMKSRATRDRVPLTLVGLVDGKVVATASILKNDLEDMPHLTPWLASVFVPPEERRKGYASKICRAVMGEMKQLGYERAYLFTPDQERLYARLGWRVLSRSMSHGKTVAVMEVDF